MNLITKEMKDKVIIEDDIQNNLPYGKIIFLKVLKEQRLNSHDNLVHQKHSTKESDFKTSITDFVKTLKLSTSVQKLQTVKQPYYMQRNSRMSAIDMYNQINLELQRKQLIKAFEHIIEKAKTVSLSQLQIENILSDVTKGAIPDFGFTNELKFGDERVGWNLFVELLSPYPKYQKLYEYIKEAHNEKRFRDEQYQYQMKAARYKTIGHGRKKVVRSISIRKNFDAPDKQNRTISFADDYNNYAGNYNEGNSPMKLAKKPIQTAFDRQMRLKEKQVQEKFNNLKGEAQQLEDQFYKYCVAVQQIKLNKLDKFKLDYIKPVPHFSMPTTPNLTPFKKGSIFSPAQVTPSDKRSVSNNNKTNSHIKIVPFQKHLQQEDNSKTLLQKLLQSFKRNDLKEKSFQEQIFLAFKSYIEKNFATKKREDIEKELNELKVFFNSIGMPPEILDDFLNQFKNHSTNVIQPNTEANRSFRQSINKISSYMELAKKSQQEFNSETPQQKSSSNQLLSPKDKQNLAFTSQFRRASLLRSPSATITISVPIINKDIPEPKFKDINQSNSASSDASPMDVKSQVVRIVKAKDSQTNREFFIKYPRVIQISQINAKTRLSQIIIKLKNIKEKIKVQLSLNSEDKKTDLNKILLISKLLSKLKQSKLELPDEFKQQIKEIGLEEFITEIEQIKEYISNNEKQEVKQVNSLQKAKITNQNFLQTFLNKRTQRNTDESQKTILDEIKLSKNGRQRTVTPKIVCQTRVHSKERETYLQRLERKLDNVSILPERNHDKFQIEQLNDYTTTNISLVPIEERRLRKVSKTPIKIRRNFYSNTTMNSPKNCDTSETNEYLSKPDLQSYLKHSAKVNEQMKASMIKPIISDNAQKMIQMRLTPSTADTRERDHDNFSSNFEKGFDYSSINSKYVKNYNKICDPFYKKKKESTKQYNIDYLKSIVKEMVQEDDLFKKIENKKLLKKLNYNTMNGSQYVPSNSSFYV